MIEIRWLSFFPCLFCLCLALPHFTSLCLSFLFPLFSFLFFLCIFIKKYSQRRTWNSSPFPKVQHSWILCIFNIKTVCKNDKHSLFLHKLKWKEALSWTCIQYWYWKGWSWHKKSCLKLLEDLDSTLKSIRLHLEIQIHVWWLVFILCFLWIEVLKNRKRAHDYVVH